MRRMLITAVIAGLALTPALHAQAQEVAAVPAAPAASQVVEGPGPFQRLLETRLSEVEAALAGDAGLDLRTRQDLNAERAWLYTQISVVEQTEIPPTN